MDQGNYALCYRWPPYAVPHFFKKYNNTDQNEKGNDYAFKDFILDSVQKMTARGESLTTTPQDQHNCCNRTNHQ